MNDITNFWPLFYFLSRRHLCLSKNVQSINVRRITGVFFLFGVEVAVEESIVDAPPDYNSHQLTSLFRCF
jgi:hypothetical protein